MTKREGGVPSLCALGSRAPLCHLLVFTSPQALWNQYLCTSFPSVPASPLFVLFMILFLIYIYSFILLIYISHISEITLFVSLWLFSLNRIPFRFIHVFVSGKLSFFFMAKYIIFTHSFTDGYLGCFHILTIVNKAAVNIRVHISFLLSALAFFWYSQERNFLC